MQKILDLSTKTISLKRNEFLTNKGDIDTNLYYVVSGSLQIFIDNPAEQQIIRLAYAGNLIAVLDSFLTEKPTNFYIQAIKKTEIKVITKPQIDEFLKSTANQLAWNKLLENLILQQMEREVDLLTPSADERYDRVLQRSPQLFQEIPNKYIANYLRMTPETLSRLKKS